MLAARRFRTARTFGTFCSARKPLMTPATGSVTMGWLTTSNLDEFRLAAGAYLRNRGAEGTPLLIVGRVPELAAALAPVLHRLGRDVRGVDATPESADAFAAAWTQRTGLAARL